MKTKLFLILLLFFTTIIKAQSTDIQNIFSSKYKVTFISRGNNFPNFSTDKNDIIPFLVSLHNNTPIEEFQKINGYSNSKIKRIEKLLIRKNWAHKNNETLKPSIFIASKEDGEKLYEYAIPISTEIVYTIKNELNSIKKDFSRTDISKNQTFEDWDFFILSNVLLDNWQISSVEKEFLLNIERPKRNGKNYYASLLEITGERESFNIYGNQVGQLSVYGNNRDNAIARNNKNYISKIDNQIFKEISANFLPKLISILNNHKNYSLKVYNDLGYSKEITFNEFFIWWYHFIYTQATDMMFEKGMLTIPKDGNFIYKME